MAKVMNKDRYGNSLSLDQMLRKFKKQIEKDDLMVELRRREFFIPKSEARRLKSERHQRIMRKYQKTATNI